MKEIKNAVNYLKPGYKRVEAIIRTEHGLRTIHTDIPKDKA